MNVAMQSSSLEGQFDALGKLAPETLGALSKWWIRNGKAVVSDVASPRSMALLAQLQLGLEHAAPRLA